MWSASLSLPYHAVSTLCGRSDRATQTIEGGPRPQLMSCRFKNMDKMIHYANKDGRVNAFYSSPDAYTAAKNSYDAAWPLKTDDFFPYADCSTCYWTGLALHHPAISE